MNVALWIMQVLLAAFFIMPGWGKITGSKAQHIEDKHIKPDGAILPIRILGAFEWLGCIGIIIPWLTNITSVLTPIAATGFSLIMLAALINHTKKKEYKMIPMLFVVFVMTAIVTYFRFFELNSN